MANVWTVKSPLNHATAWSQGDGNGASAFLAGAEKDDVCVRMETWDGVVWSDRSDLNNARSQGTGGGDSNDAIVMGSRLPQSSNITESWNGSVWTVISEDTPYVCIPAGGGSSLDAIMMGGHTNDPVDLVRTWNGTVWAAVSSLSVARMAPAGDGDSLDAIVMGGLNGIGNTAEVWNGTAWSSIPNLPQRQYAFAGGGDSTNAICMGGYYDPSYGGETTQTWNGTSWTNEANRLNVGRRALAGGGNSVGALSFGGKDSSHVTRDTTESWGASLMPQIRAFDVSGTEPTDRTTQGVVPTPTNKLDFGNIPSTGGDSDNVCVVIFRIDDMATFTEIFNMKFFVYDKSAFSSTVTFYADITDIWTQNKSASQVKSGTPGALPDSEPTSPNLTKIGGGNITGTDHANTSQYIYLLLSSSGTEPIGEKDFRYKIVFSVM